MNRIYLDHAATSPVHPEAAEAMRPYLTEMFGNPSSTHHFGRQSRSGLDRSRRSIAAAIGAAPEDIVFTGGGTEADNLAVLGYVRHHRPKEGGHVITCQTEHHGVLYACRQLEREGIEVTYLPVDEYGRITPLDLQEALRTDTLLVTLMTANNETGVVHPVEEFAAVLNDHPAVFHTDAVQALGKMDINVQTNGVDMLAASAHKFNGPNGIGFLYVRPGIQLDPLLFGGQQERGRRAGTENTAGAVGMSRALELSLEHLQERQENFTGMKQKMSEQLQASGITFHVNGSGTSVLPNVMNISFPDADVEQLLMNLDIEGIAVSSGSACTAGSVEPSHVLTAMFGDTPRSRAAVRFSFGLGTEPAHVEKAAEAVVRVMDRMKAAKL
ncbi:cysteine desulfurase family protein [Alkalicoccus chagannorensis]|uniref:cysteine desulfurase family protein n=1 Tax=Alkalicoccus chagannorensis TaxID=427072 RepID=UPI000409B86D|nr:cysteine desulfurase family protein [Alkalicoccus chagannorensis]